MEKRKFGKTNANVSVLALGGFGPGVEEVTQKEADIYFKKALDAGINMIDIAPSYGNAETKVTNFMKEYRDNFFIAEKTMERTKEGAEKELQQSLKNLATDHFDCYQFHAVKSLEELDTIFGPNGAMEAFQEAKESGIIKYIGLTGHDDIRIHKKALELFDFDVLLLPVNMTSIISPDPVNDYRSVLKETIKKDVGITAIKAIQRGRWKGKPKYHTWYEPFDDAASIQDAINFTLSQKGVTTYSMAGDIRLWDYMLDAGKNFTLLNDLEQEKLIEKYSKLHTAPLFPEIK